MRGLLFSKNLPSRSQESAHGDPTEKPSRERPRSLCVRISQTAGTTGQIIIQRHNRACLFFSRLFLTFSLSFPSFLHPLLQRIVHRGVGLIYRNLDARCLRGNPLRLLFQPPALPPLVSSLYRYPTHGPSGEIPRWSPVQNGPSIIRDPREPRSCPSSVARRSKTAKKYEEKIR